MERNEKLWELTKYLPTGKEATHQQREAWYSRFFYHPPVVHRDTFYASWEDVGKSRYNSVERTRQL